MPHSHFYPPLNLQCFPPGMPDDIIQKGKDIKGVSEIVQNGKHFKFTITAGSKVIQNEFTLGEECEMEFMTGEKIKVGVAPFSHPLLPELFLEPGPRLPPSRLPAHNSYC